MKISSVSGAAGEAYAIKTRINLFFSDQLTGFDVESTLFSPSSTKNNPLFIKGLFQFESLAD